MPFFLDVNAKLLGDRELAQQLAQLSSTAIPKAIRDGVRYASRGAKTAVAKEVGAVSPVRAARIKEDLGVQLSPDGDTAQVWASSSPMSALQFKPRQNRKGLVLTFYKGQKTLIPSGFMQTSQAQRWRGKLPFKPSETGTYSYDRLRKKPRKQMEFVHGISLASMVLGGRHSDRIMSAVQERTSEQLAKGILRSLGGQARGFGRG